jgi:S1-C subfamily serine protease
MRNASFLKIRILFIFLVFTLATVWVIADLTPAQIENGKKATALVQINIIQNKAQVPGRGIALPPGIYKPTNKVRVNGTAFCINPEGWFVTCNHVSKESPDGKVNLILNAGEKDQTMLEAKIVRSDKDADLALLKVNNQPPFAVLQLGSVEGLAETARLTAFGYPFGEELALKENTFPSISVSTGAITSLRKKNGKLEMIQLDASINPGNSGGPVLNSEGRLIGIVNAKIEGAAVNFAIPVSHLQEFLSTPDAEFIPPALTPGNRNKAATFKASVLAITGKNEDYQAELTLTSGGVQRKVTMKRGVDGFFAEEVPVPPQKEPISLLITANFGGNSVSGTIADQSFSVAGKTYQLSKVQKLESGAKPSMVLDDGTKVEGTIIGLSSVSFKLNETQTMLDLAKATSVTVRPTGDTDSIEYQVTVNRSGKSVKTVSGIIPIGNTAAVTASNITAPTTTDSTSPTAKTTSVQLGAGQSEVTLPSDISDVAVGGGGKFLILHLHKLRQLAIFDTSAAKVIKYLPIDWDDILFTAGAEKLIVVATAQNLISRYNLKTLEREATAPMPVKGTINAIALGSNSPGPLLVLAFDNSSWPAQTTFSFINPDTLATEKLSTRGRNVIMLRPNDVPVQIRASADGRVFGVWRADTSSMGMQTMILEENEVQINSSPSASFGLLVPGPDGQIIYAPTGLLTNDIKNIGSQTGRSVLRVPAANGNFYLEVDEKGKISVCLSNDSRILVTLSKVGDVGLKTLSLGLAWSESNHKNFLLDKHIYLVPDARLILGIPSSNDRLILQPFDPMQALKDAKFDYLFVSSSPITSAAKNSNYTYQIQVESKRGGVTYSLESGPSGMKITPDGKLTWAAASASTEETVIVRITDLSKQEVFHAFKIRVK